MIADNSPVADVALLAPTYLRSDEFTTESLADFALVTPAPQNLFLGTPQTQKAAKGSGFRPSKQPPRGGPKRNAGLVAADWALSGPNLHARNRCDLFCHCARVLFICYFTQPLMLR